MKRIYIGIFLVALILLTVCDSAMASQVGYAIVTSEEIEKLTEEWERSIELVIGKGKSRRLDHDSSDAKALIEKMKIKFVPYVVFDKGIEENDNFFDLVKQGLIEKKLGEYVIPEKILLQAGVMLFNREAKPRELNVFVMSFDPTAKDALRQIGSFLKKNPGAIDVTCHYLVTFREFGIDSPRGPGEIKENIYQLLIQKYYPDKFWQYLEKYRDGKSFGQACDELEIDANDIMSRQKEGVMLLEADFKLAREMGIDTSPTFLWQNRVLLRNVTKLREFLQPLAVADEVTKVSMETGALPIVVFYKPGCANCDQIIDEFFPELQREFGDAITFEYYDTSIQENFEKKLRMEEELGLLSVNQVPEVFVGGIALIGEQDVKSRLRELIKKKAQHR